MSTKEKKRKHEIVTNIVANEKGTLISDDTANIDNKENCKKIKSTSDYKSKSIVKKKKNSTKNNTKNLKKNNQSNKKIKKVSIKNINREEKDSDTDSEDELKSKDPNFVTAAELYFRIVDTPRDPEKRKIKPRDYILDYYIDESEEEFSPKGEDEFEDDEDSMSDEYLWFKEML